MLPQPDGILPPHGASNHHDPYLLIPKDLISLREGRNSLSLIPVGHGEAQQHQHRSPREMEIVGPRDAGGTPAEQPNLPWHDPAVLPEGRNLLFQVPSLPVSPGMLRGLLLKGGIAEAQDWGMQEPQPSGSLRGTSIPIPREFPKHRAKPGVPEQLSHLDTAGKPGTHPSL